MREPLRRNVLYFFERFLVRGPQYRFLAVVAVIGVVSILGGLLLVAGEQTQETTGEAVWWAFLRLTDPGYLGDDEGVWRRIVSTLLTVLGYVIFLGAMVAILTQWLDNTLNRLEQGLTPIRMSNHVVILGWTNRTPRICRELIMAEGRLERWLERRGVRRLRIAILATQVGPERDLELRGVLGPAYRRQQFVLRSGNSLRTSDLLRVDLIHAASIVLPAIEATSDGALSHDATVIKILRSIAAEYRGAESLPTCVCEIIDPRKVAVAHLAYGGPLEVLASDVVIGRLLGDSLRQPGCAAVFEELLTHGTGGTLYLRTWHGEPCTVADVMDRARSAIFLGVATESEFCPAPPLDMAVNTDDALVFIAREYEDTTLDGEGRPPAPPIEALLLDVKGGGGSILMLGWSRRMPDLLLQLDSHEDERWRIDVLSAVDPQRREADLEQHGVALERTQLSHRVGDLTVPGTLAAADPGAYDRVFLVASDWPPTGEASDARTITSYLGLKSIVDPLPMLVELADEANLDLLDGRDTEALVSPRILSRLLAQVVLHRRMRLVVDELFGAGSTHVYFAKAQYPRPIRLAELVTKLREQRKIPIGVRRGGLGGELVLANLDAEIDFSRGDLVIIADATERGSAQASESRAG